MRISLAPSFKNEAQIKVPGQRLYCLYCCFFNEILVEENTAELTIARERERERFNNCKNERERESTVARMRERSRVMMLVFYS